jgi:hypothetical protein
MKKDTNQTAMQELLQHFIDAWSSPGDCWNPGKVIDKVESMIKKEKEQIIEARIDGITCAAAFQEMPSKYTTGEQYYNQTYKPETI